jgi:hypothetical protein
MTLKFTHGAGDGKKTGCLRTMANALIGQPEELAKLTPENQICPVMGSFIVTTNDNIPTDILGEVYGPLAAEILGTITKDEKIMRERAIMFAEWADNIPRPKRFKVVTPLTEWAYEQFRLGKDPVHVAGDVAAKAAKRATTVLRGSKKETSHRKVAEACRDILHKVATSHERAPVKIVNQELLVALSSKATV